MTDFIHVVTTTESRETAHAIGMAAVKTNLAASANVSGPIESMFRWKGEVRTAEEWLLTLKTRRYLFDDLVAAIQEVHPYEVPSIVAFSVNQVADSYAEWLTASVRPEEE